MKKSKEVDLVRKAHKDTWVPFTGAKSLDEILSPEQLAGIGSVIIAYNYVELALDRAFMETIEAKGRARDIIVTNLSASKKVQEIKCFACRMGVPKDAHDFMCQTFGEDHFVCLKRLRDTIAHATIIDPGRGIGAMRAYNFNRYDILLSVDVLRGVYERLALIQKEIAKFALILRLADRIRSYRDSAKDTSREERHIQQCLDQARNLRRSRSDLAALAELPAPIQSPPIWEDEDQRFD